MIGKARRWVFFPLLIAAYPVVALYAQNATMVPLGELFVPVLSSVAAAVAVWALTWLLTRDPAKAGLLTVLAVAVFYTLLKASPWLEEWLFYLVAVIWVKRDVTLWTPLVVGGELLAAGILGWLIVAKIKDLGRWTIVLNVFALLLLAQPAATIARVRLYGVPATEPAADPSGQSGKLPAAYTSAQRVKQPPDIYYIILDGYARSDVMLDRFGYDNRPFIDWLAGKGFTIAHASTANYCQTPLSLSSSLNAVYLNGLFDPESSDKTPLAHWIGDAAAIRTFRELGYQFVTFASGFDETEHPEAENYLSPFAHDTAFHRMLIEGTPLLWFWRGPGSSDSYDRTRDRTLFTLHELPKVAHWRAPTFTFAHILSPHPPFVFGEHGEDVSQHKQRYYLTDGNLFQGYYGDRADYKRGYRDQAAFLTAQIRKTIDGILANSAEPPIIILQSDHGSGLGLSTASAGQTDLVERMSILNAYYLPGLQAGNEPVYQSITPVNSFRVVLNSYFNAGLALLPDRSYYSTWSEPYRFIDVTERVRKECGEKSAQACAPQPGQISMPK
jgi:hypothetical protein